MLVAIVLTVLLVVFLLYQSGRPKSPVLAADGARYPKYPPLQVSPPRKSISKTKLQPAQMAPTRGAPARAPAGRVSASKMSACGVSAPAVLCLCWCEQTHYNWQNQN